MYESDWILRQIEMLVAAIVKTLRNGDTDRALELCDDAVREVLDMDPVLVDALDSESLTLLVRAGVDGSLRTFMLGEILAARVEALEAAGRLAEARRDAERARELLGTALPDAEGEVAERIHELLGWLDRPA